MKKLNFDKCTDQNIIDEIAIIESKPINTKSISNENFQYFQELKIELARRKAISESQYSGLYLKNTPIDSWSYKELVDELEILNQKRLNKGIIKDEIALRFRIQRELNRRDNNVPEVDFEDNTSTEKVIAKRKFWSIEILKYEDGTSQMNRTNDGFNINELMGLAHYLQMDLYNQWNGECPTPDIVKRTVITD